MTAGEKFICSALFRVVLQRMFLERAEVTSRTFPLSFIFALSGWRSLSLVETKTGPMLLNSMLLKITFPVCPKVTAVTAIYNSLMLCIGMCQNLTLLFGCEGTFITLEPEAQVL